MPYFWPIHMKEREPYRIHNDSPALRVRPHAHCWSDIWTSAWYWSRHSFGSHYLNAIPLTVAPLTFPTLEEPTHISLNSSSNQAPRTRWGTPRASPCRLPQACHTTNSKSCASHGSPWKQTCAYVAKGNLFSHKHAATLAEDMNTYMGGPQAQN